MIECALNSCFDLIITKEISRFARNTLDSIYYTRELKKHGVGVIFMNDGINTLDGDAELRLSIMASIAQEESRKTSERVKWGQKRRMEQGVVFGRSMLGYDVRDGKMYINEEGAEIVRLIFQKFADEGKGTHVIARELAEAGIKPMRVKQWSNTVILRVIRNEKYCGDLVQKKTYTPDFLSHEKKCNRGEEEFVIIKEHHEPIVSRELFEKANRILDEKSLSQKGKAKYSNRYIFSGKIKCGQCGASFVARCKTRKDGSIYRSWRCYHGCSCGSIRNKEVVHIMYLVCKELKLNRRKIADDILKTVADVISADNETEVQKLISDINKSVEEIVNGVQYENEFYAQLLDKMVVNDKNHIDVYLNMLPYKFSYALSSAVAFSDTDVPIYVTEMLHIAKTSDKSVFISLFSDAIKTADKPVKYSENNKYSYSEKPKSVRCGADRYINIYCTVSDII